MTPGTSNEEVWHTVKVTIAPDMSTGLKVDVDADTYSDDVGARKDLYTASRLPDQSCTTLTIGSGPVVGQTFAVEPGYTCHTIVNKDNWLGGHEAYGDTYAVTQAGDSVSVVRSDTGNTDEGWDMNLEFKCCPDFYTASANIAAYDGLADGQVYLSFSARTGGHVNYHSVRNIRVTKLFEPQNCDNQVHANIYGKSGLDCPVEFPFWDPPDACWENWVYVSVAFRCTVS